MKIFYKLVFLLIPITSISGISPSEKTFLIQHLIDVNANWQLHQKEVENHTISFQSDIQRIQTHLLLVEKSLRANIPKKLTNLQRKNRGKCLTILHQYALAEKFPINTMHPTRQPYFIDFQGTHCAVGFLVKETGYPEISKSIAQTQNFAYVKEIISPELVQWSIEFGFTLEELAWIQPGYLPTQTYAPLGTGANGKVTQSTVFGSKWIVSGEFDTLNNLPCLHIGVYENGQMDCLGAGLVGTINDLDYNYSLGLMAVGSLSSDGQKYPLAKYSNNVWTYDSIPSRPGAIASALYSNYSSLFLAINHPTEPEKQEIWKKIDGNWQQFAIVNGKIHAFDIYTGFFGAFDSIALFENNEWTNYTSKNALMLGQLGAWQTVSGILPDTIFTFEKNNNVVFVGGSTTSNLSSSGVIVSSIFNGVAQPMLTAADLMPSNYYSVNDLQIIDNSSIYIAGEFESNWAMFSTKNIGKLLPSSGMIESMGYFDQPIYTAGLIGQTLFLGGDFSQNNGGGWGNPETQNVNRLAKLEGIANLEENHNSSIAIAISPNPSYGNLSISGIEENLMNMVEILDNQGKICYKSNSLEMDLSHLKPGAYFVRIVSTDGSVSTKKWVKK